MDFWSNFVISSVKVLLASLHVDVNKAATLKKVLLSVAADINSLYDVTPSA